MAYAAFQAGIDGAVATAVRDFVTGVIRALPRIAAGTVFLALAAVAISGVRRAARFVLARAYPPDQHAIVDLAVAILSLLLWFAAALALFNVLGLDDIAASLGTASGFVALGVAYALSDMIADTVAGVYLLRDPDFNPGDRVSTGDVTGTVASIGLRKSRLETVEGDTVVLANQEVDAQWTLEGDRRAEPAGTPADSVDGSTGEAIEDAGRADESADEVDEDAGGSVGSARTTTDDRGE